MAAITLNNIDKSNWASFPFEKIAKRISESVDPNKTELEVYIGLEHLDAETVHIRRHGSPADVNGGKLKCYPGDVIFGKRRAYQRKAGIVTQEGICSAHSFVFRANEEVIDARLFPFFLHSDQFMHRMVDVSVGGLSPTINWSDLKHQEFHLPPKAQQAEVAELLWAMDTVIEKDLEVLERLENDIQSLFLSKIIDFNIEGLTITGILDNLNKKLGLGLLKDFGTFLKGKGIPKDDVIESGIPCIRYGEIYTSHYIVIRKFRSFISEEVASTSFQLNKGDIVFAGSGETITEIGKGVCFVDDFEAYAGGDTIIFRPDSKKINSVYLSYLLNSLISRLQLDKMGTGATVAHIYPEDLKKIRIPLLDIFIQNEIAVEMETIFKSIDQLKSKLQSSKALQKALINQVF